MEIINTIGRRKTSVARIYVSEGSGTITVNNRALREYFTTDMLINTIHEPFVITNTQNKYDLKVNLSGGGFTGQAEALRLAIARALVKVDPEYRKPLKDKGLLKRDPRMVERKKPGQPKARKRFQFSKR